MIEGTGHRCLLDTNVLLRAGYEPDGNISIFLGEMRQTVLPCFCAQSVSEFWNVSTRPRHRNGLGLAVETVAAAVANIEDTMGFLADSEESYRMWRTLVEELKVSGKQVHDAKIAAVMLANGVDELLTFNARDFARYKQLHVLDAAELIPR